MLYQWLSSRDWFSHQDSSTDDFDLHWELLSKRSIALMPDINDVYYISHGFGTGWTMTSFADTIPGDVTKFHTYLAFDDAIVAIQCKLSLL
jgi:hypothetical protein